MLLPAVTTNLTPRKGKLELWREMFGARQGVQMAKQMIDDIGPGFADHMKAFPEDKNNTKSLEVLTSHCAQ